MISSQEGSSQGRHAHDSFQLSRAKGHKKERLSERWHFSKSKLKALQVEYTLSLKVHESEAWFPRVVMLRSNKTFKRWVVSVRWSGRCPQDKVTVLVPKWELRGKSTAGSSQASFLTMQSLSHVCAATMWLSQGASSEVKSVVWTVSLQSISPFSQNTQPHEFCYSHRKQQWDQTSIWSKSIIKGHQLKKPDGSQVDYMVEFLRPWIKKGKFLKAKA